MCTYVHVSVPYEYYKAVGYVATNIKRTHQLMAEKLKFFRFLYIAIFFIPFLLMLIIVVMIIFEIKLTFKRNCLDSESVKVFG